VDPVREAHALLEADTGEHGGQRLRDAVEGVVVVVEDDHLPRRVETAAGVAGARLADGRRGRRAHVAEASNAAL
jgi:hypothetical protein